MALILQLPVEEHPVGIGDSVHPAPHPVRVHRDTAVSRQPHEGSAAPATPVASAVTAATPRVAASASAPASAPASDSVAVADSVAVDTAAHDTLYYIMLDPPAVADLPPNSGPAAEGWGMSWILTLLTVLFVIVAIRFRSNSKYLSALFRDAVEVRERRNVFDETVREESFMLILNVLWCLSVGVLLYTLIQYSLTDPGISARLRSAMPGDIPPGGWTGEKAPLAIAISIGVTLIWQLVMTALYSTVGRVFSDRLHTRMWLTGYLAVSGLSTLIFFPLALLALCYPGDPKVILWVAFGGFVAAKLMFIVKGFRIFFKEITSWLLFLYYLCSLEIVPLILLYISTVALCATIL